MPQQEMTSNQELTAGGGGTINGSTTTFQTGTKCTVSGTYTAENRYMRNVIVLAAGEDFPPFVDGKKISWTALTTTASSGGSKTSDGGFTSVKVEAGTV